MDVVSTAEVPPGEQFAYWSELHGKLWVPYDVRCDRRPESGFRAEVGISEFGPVQATVMTTMPHAVHRTPRLIRRADPDVFWLGCMVRGGVAMTKGAQHSAVSRGDLVLYDPSQPYVGEFAPDVPVQELLLLRFPRSSLPLPAQDLRRLTTLRIPGDRGVGALSSQFLLQLARRMPEFAPADTARVATLTLDVLTTALATALDRESVLPPDTRRRALLAGIHAFIDRNLGDPGLTPATIAAARHISVRYLHKLFQQDGKTVGGWVRAQRLERCRRDLADPRLAARPVHAIAHRWGFRNPAHFSQAFRRAYGVSAGEYRRGVRAD